MVSRGRRSKGASVNGVEATGHLCPTGLINRGILGRFAPFGSLDRSPGRGPPGPARPSRCRLSADPSPSISASFLESAMEVTGTGVAILLRRPTGPFTWRWPGFSSADARASALGSGGSSACSDELPQSVSNADRCAAGQTAEWSDGARRPGLRPLARGRRDRGHDCVDGRKRAAGFAQLRSQVLESLAEHVAIVVPQPAADRKIRRSPHSAMAHAAHSPALLEDLQRQIVIGKAPIDQCPSTTQSPLVRAHPIRTSVDVFSRLPGTLIGERYHQGHRRRRRHEVVYRAHDEGWPRHR